MSYTYSWEIKNELDPRDFITWEMEEETEEESEFNSLFIGVEDFDTDEILQPMSVVYGRLLSTTTKEKDNK